MSNFFDLKLADISCKKINIRESSLSKKQNSSSLFEETLLIIMKDNIPIKAYLPEDTKSGPLDKVALRENDFREVSFSLIDEGEPILSALSLLNSSSIVITVNSNKGPTGFIESSKALSSLANKYEELRQIFLGTLEASGDMITITDENLNVRFWNSEAEHFYGIKKEEIIGKDLKGFFSKSSLVLAKVLETGRPVKDSYNKPRPGLYVLINSTPIKPGNRLIGGVSIERNITEMVYLNRELFRTNTELNQLQQEMNHNNNGPFSNIYGHSHRLKEVVDIAKKVAHTDVPVLIRGESGTGKELFARAIYQASNRRDKPYIPINCGAIPSNLVESELFGYEAGAFTGAEKSGKKGRFEQANGGTLFLDEIGEMDFSMQVKLLRVLQDKVFFRVGGSKPVKVNVRIIAATNRNLEEMLKKGLFRKDLYYRLNVVSLEVPPLRERKRDILELVYLFVNEFAKHHNKKIKEVSADLITVLLKYNWPGNVRELRNIIERLVVLTEGSVASKEFLPQNILDNPEDDYLDNDDDQGKTYLDSITKDAERKTIVKTLQEVQGNKTKAAKVLGIPRSTLYYRLEKLGLKD